MTQHHAPLAKQQAASMRRDKFATVLWQLNSAHWALVELIRDSQPGTVTEIAELVILEQLLHPAVERGNKISIR